MQQMICPCFWMNNNAGQAAEFYSSVFDSAKVLDQNPMVIHIELLGKRIMLLNGGDKFQVNPSVSLFVQCTTIKETRDVWQKLLEGSTELMPLNKYEWSELYGWLQDKFGLTWQIMVANDSSKQTVVTPTFLFTKDYFGKAEEAMKFYLGLFPNSQISTSIPYPSGNPNSGKLMYAEFSLNGYHLIAMDGPDEHRFSFNEGVSFVITCDNQDEIDYYWQHLTANGGQESMCGWCRDKFGVWWQVVPAILGKLMSDRTKAPKVIEAFLKMRKFNIQGLLQA